MYPSMREDIWHIEGRVDAVDRVVFACSRPKGTIVADSILQSDGSYENDIDPQVNIKRTFQQTPQIPQYDLTERNNISNLPHQQH